MGVILSRKVGGGDDSRIFSRATQKLLYRQNISPGMQHLNLAYLKNQNQGQKVGGTKHSLSPGGKKVGGTCPPPGPPPNYAHACAYYTYAIA